MDNIRPARLKITSEDYGAFSKEDQRFMEQSGDRSIAFALVAKKHGVKIVGPINRDYDLYWVTDIPKP